MGINWIPSQLGIKQVEGYRGVTRDFMSPISESAFGGDVLKFHDSTTSSIENGFSINLVKRSPYHSTDIVNREFSDSAMYYTRENFVFNEMTASTSEYQEFHPRLLGDKRKVRNGTLQVSINGWPLRSMSGSTIDQSISSNGVEIFLDSTYKKVRVKKLYIEDESKVAGERVLLGIDLNNDDTISFKYQQETS